MTLTLLKFGELFLQSSNCISYINIFLQWHKFFKILHFIYIIFFLLLCIFVPGMFFFFVCSVGRLQARSLCLAALTTLNLCQLITIIGYAFKIQRSKNLIMVMHLFFSSLWQGSYVLRSLLNLRWRISPRSFAQGVVYALRFVHHVVLLFIPLSYLQ